MCLSRAVWTLSSTFLRSEDDPPAGGAVRVATYSSFSFAAASAVRASSEPMNQGIKV